MIKYNRILLNFMIFASIGGAIFYWGVLNLGWFRIIGAIFFIGALLRLINELHFRKELDSWLKCNHDRFILFYPAKQKIQSEIKSKIIPFINSSIYQVYYEGPKIRGDLKMRHVIELMNIDKRIKPHHPSIIKVKEKSLEVISLNELDTDNIDDELATILIKKINECT